MTNEEGGSVIDDIAEDERQAKRLALFKSRAARMKSRPKNEEAEEGDPDMTTEEPKKRRGRPPKVKSAGDVDAAPKKRGRKPGPQAKRAAAPPPVAKSGSQVSLSDVIAAMSHAQDLLASYQEQRKARIAALAEEAL